MLIATVDILILANTQIYPAIDLSWVTVLLNQSRTLIT